ncbi:MAG: hypothetical protein V2J25_12295 [Desulfatiglans sp.]|jgi:hypothetical protein|nr:hypothetical protein [Thermodesulfobacteriota bacterium]MEE4353641.1 hypothetical protein [Desulfatiglans sp.]
MIFTTKDGQSFDTDKDLTAEERHVLQKLVIWETMASSLDEFRERTKEAFKRGWNGSGPVVESRALKLILEELEQKVLLRVESP